MSVPSSSATKVTLVAGEDAGVSGDDRVPRPPGPTPITPGIAAPAPSAASMSSNRAIYAATGASSPSRSRQPRTASRSSSVASTSGKPVAADIVSEQVQRALDRDRVDDDAEQVDRRHELLVERARAVDVALPVAAHHLLHLRADDVRVHADAARAADLEEREDEVVVAGVEVEAELDDRARLREVGVRLLHRTHASGSRRAARSRRSRG